MTETYERPEICSVCTDVCCAIMPGIMWPEDVKRVAGTDSIGDALRAVLSTGDYAIDWWCGDPRNMSVDYSTHAYYVRPRRANHHNLFDPTWASGACVFWNEATGCRLPAEQRPHECRNLEPHWAGSVSNTAAGNRTRRSPGGRGVRSWEQLGTSWSQRHDHTPRLPRRLPQPDRVPQAGAVLALPGQPRRR